MTDIPSLSDLHRHWTDDEVRKLAQELLAMIELAPTLFPWRCMSESEIADFNREHGSNSMVIGNYRITRLN